MVRYAIAVLGLMMLTSSCKRDTLFCGQVNDGLELGNVTRIGFGSCAHQGKSQPILSAAAEDDIDVFVWLGDNIYGDTENMSVLIDKYGELGCKPEFRKLNSETYFLAVWDDHDYGANDAGKEYPKKEESKEIFLSFWGEPKDSDRRAHPGIYHSLITGEPGQRVQFIMLDTRTFRDSLLWAGPNDLNDYRPHTDTTVTMLGQDQWAWLESQLLEPADLRVICTSTQFGTSYNGFEAWANFPHERKRLAELLVSTQANGVVFISGDIHYGEISGFAYPGCYPLFDVTSSGITQTWNNLELNDNRIGSGAFFQNNYGMIEVAWHEPEPTLSFSIRDIESVKVNEVSVNLSSLAF